MDGTHDGRLHGCQDVMGGPAFLERLEAAQGHQESMWGIEVLSGTVVAYDGTLRLATYGTRHLWGKLADDANPYELAGYGHAIDMGDERALNDAFRDGDWLACPTDIEVDRAFVRADERRVRLCLGEPAELRAQLAQGTLVARLTDAGGGRTGVVVELAHQGAGDVSQVLAEVVVDDDARAHPGPSASVFVQAGDEVHAIDVKTEGDMRRNGNVS